jgi:hypothetical protein
MTDAARSALRALWDCGTVRAPWTHPGYRALRDQRLATYTAVIGTNLAVHRLNDRGREIARSLFK